jgi:hypothetical protein
VSDNLTVKFWAIVAKVQTMADGGLRVYLDLPEDAVEQVAVLMQYKRMGVVADVEATPRLDDGQERDESRKIKF